MAECRIYSRSLLGFIGGAVSLLRPIPNNPIALKSVTAVACFWEQPHRLIMRVN